MKTLINILIITGLMFGLAYYGVEAWIKEDDARVIKLNQHHYDVALARDTIAPAAPTGVRPNFGESNAPKVHMYQDASRRK